MKFLIPDEQATLTLGKILAELLPAKALVFLNGPLGAGKTTLVRGFLRACGHTGSTKSPTYTLVEPYHLDNKIVYHFDLYRLGEAEELEYIGIRDYLQDTATCLIEWPERGVGFIPDADLVINLDYEGGSRRITLETADSPLTTELQQLLSVQFESLS